MAIRTTSAAVKLIIEVDDTISEDLLPFLETASYLVDVHCEPNGASAVELELVERWLAAHFYAQRDPRAASESVGGVSISYQSSVKSGLANTHYGQMAMRLDSSGALALLEDNSSKGSKRNISIVHLGKDSC